MKVGLPGLTNSGNDLMQPWGLAQELDWIYLKTLISRSHFCDRRRTVATFHTTCFKQTLAGILILAAQMKVTDSLSECCVYHRAFCSVQPMFSWIMKKGHFAGRFVRVAIF